MWQELHSQQLPRGQNHAKSDMKWGEGPFSNKYFFYRDVFQKKLFAGTKFKTDPNYRDDYHI